MLPFERTALNPDEKEAVVSAYCSSYKRPTFMARNTIVMVSLLVVASNAVAPLARAETFIFF